jgi:hypothetical protein
MMDVSVEKAVSTVPGVATADTQVSLVVKVRLPG